MLRKLLVLGLVVITLVSITHVATASRNGHEGNPGQREVQSAEQQQRALEQIQAAEEMIAQSDNLVSSLSHDPPHAAVVLLDQAKEHLTNAREAFDEGKCGETYGLANAAEMLARNALRMIGEMEQPPNEENETQISPIPVEPQEEPLVGENVEQPVEQEILPPPENEVLPQPENIPYPDFWLPQGVGPNRNGITIYIEAIENTSGNDWVYVHWTSPSGARGGFFILLNETLEGIRDATIMIPKYLETRAWQITSVEVYDKSNAPSYGGPYQPNPILAFDGLNDLEGTIVHRVWISPNMIGPWEEDLAFYVDVAHNISRVDYVEVELASPSGSQDGFFFGLRNETSDSVRDASTTWCSETGTWRASYVGVYDKV